MQIHFHSPQQQEVLKSLLSDVVQKLMAIRFEDPKVDEQMIRYHAALSGKYELLFQMLTDDYPAPEPEPQPESN